jgi:hypothetical protein
VKFAQDLLVIPLVLQLLRAEVLVNPQVQYLSGHLKFGLPGEEKLKCISSFEFQVSFHQTVP